MAPVFSDRQRADTSASSGESMYDFLDRVAGPVWDRIRQLIEDWVTDYSPDDRAELAARLRKSNGTLSSRAHIGSCCSSADSGHSDSR